MVCMCEGMLLRTNQRQPEPFGIREGGVQFMARDESRIRVAAIVTLPVWVV
jgi:hypothetical protein